MIKKHGRNPVFNNNLPSASDFNRNIYVTENKNKYNKSNSNITETNKNLLSDNYSKTEIHSNMRIEDHVTNNNDYIKPKYNNPSYNNYEKYNTNSPYSSSKPFLIKDNNYLKYYSQKNLRMPTDHALNHKNPASKGILLSYFK